MAEHLTTVTDIKQRTTLTKHRLTDERLCQPCTEGKVETGLHFLIERTKLQPVRTKYFPKFKLKHPEFDHITNKIPILLGEHGESCSLAADYVSTCPTLRNRE